MLSRIGLVVVDDRGDIGRWIGTVRCDVGHDARRLCCDADPGGMRRGFDTEGSIEGSGTSTERSCILAASPEGKASGYKKHRGPVSRVLCELLFIMDVTWGAPLPLGDTCGATNFHWEVDCRNR